MHDSKVNERLRIFRKDVAIENVNINRFCEIIEVIILQLATHDGTIMSFEQLEKQGLDCSLESRSHVCISLMMITLLCVCQLSLRVLDGIK